MESTFLSISLRDPALPHVDLVPSHPLALDIWIDSDGTVKWGFLANERGWPASVRRAEATQRSIELVEQAGRVSQDASQLVALIDSQFGDPDRPLTGISHLNVYRPTLNISTQTMNIVVASPWGGIITLRGGDAERISISVVGHINRRLEHGEFAREATALLGEVAPLLTNAETFLQELKDGVQ